MMISWTVKPALAISAQACLIFILREGCLVRHGLDRGEGDVILKITSLISLGVTPSIKQTAQGFICIIAHQPFDHLACEWQAVRVVEPIPHR